MTSSATRRPPADRAVHARSSVTNGSRFLPPGVDGRSQLARRFRDLYLQLVEDLGGPDEVGEAQRQLCRRAALLAAQAEALEAAAALGQSLDLPQYLALTNVLSRTLSRLGLKRAGPRTPTLTAYIEGRRAP